MLNKNTEGEKRICVNFFHTHVTPFVEYLLHFIWLRTIYCLSRAQSRLATWQQLLTAGAEFFHRRQVRFYIKSERHCKIVLYVGSKIWCSYFLLFTHSFSK
jgi:hypothetical protein